MSGWMRYPGRWAHCTGDSEPILNVPRSQRIGTRWRTHCGRTVSVFWDTDRPWSGEWVDPLELRLENPRGWCLRCAYWTALEALILPIRSYRAFVDLVERAGVPLEAA
jgi:hypothetical protein